jgi:integrase
MNTWNNITPTSFMPMKPEIIKTIFLAFKERKENKKSWYADRDYLFIKLLIETACRPGELLKSKIEDYDLTNRILKIPAENEKTEKDKFFVLTHSTTFLLEEYFEKRKTLITARKNHVFFSNEKKTNHIGEGYFSGMIYKPIIKELGLYIPVKHGKSTYNDNNLYALRSGGFTYLNKVCGYQPKEVQQLSQHTNLATLERHYLKYDMLATQEILVNELSKLTSIA